MFAVSPGEQRCRPIEDEADDPGKQQRLVVAQPAPVERRGEKGRKEAHQVQTKQEQRRPFGREDRGGEKYPAISPSWRADWHRLTIFFDYPPEVRKVIYTTNAIESLNYSLRKVLKNRGAFPNDDAIMKVHFMGLHNVAKKWTRPIRDWKAALNQFVILFGDRVPT